MENNSVSIVALGGVREGAKNFFAVKSGEDIFILDAGLKYPENDQLGVDYIIPDMSYIIDNKEKIAGVFLSHGHLDSIGALPRLLEEVQPPIFGSELTISLAKNLISKRSDLSSFNNFNVVDENSVIDFEDNQIEFFNTTHTIPGSLGIVIKTNKGQIVYTGNFKFDQTAKGIYKTDFNRISEIGNEKVLALLADTQGSESPLHNINDSVVEEYIIDLFKKNKERRMIVSSSSSNIQRIQQLINAAYSNNRRIAIHGSDYNNFIKVALDTKKLILPETKNKIFVNIRNIRNIPDEELMILTIGKMGDPIKNLLRITTNEDRYVRTTKNDFIFVATDPASSSEALLSDVKDAIYKNNNKFSILKDKLKTSGHASQNDIQFLINFLKPEFFWPVSSEYRVMTKSDFIAQEVGVKKENIFLAKNGDSYTYKEDGKFVLENSYVVENDLIDGTIQNIGPVVLKDREILSNDGIFILVVTIDKKKSKVISKVKMNTKGFLFAKDNKKLLSEISELSISFLNDFLSENKEFNWNDLKNDFKEKISEFIYKETKRRPIIMPVIMEVNQNRIPKKN